MAKKSSELLINRLKREQEARINNNPASKINDWATSAGISSTAGWTPNKRVETPTAKEELPERQSAMATEALQRKQGVTTPRLSTVKDVVPSMATRNVSESDQARYEAMRKAQTPEAIDARNDRMDYDYTRFRQLMDSAIGDKEEVTMDDIFGKITSRRDGFVGSDNPEELPKELYKYTINGNTVARSNAYLNELADKYYKERNHDRLLADDPEYRKEYIWENFGVSPEEYKARIIAGYREQIAQLRELSEQSKRESYGNLTDAAKDVLSNTDINPTTHKGYEDIQIDKLEEAVNSLEKNNFWRGVAEGFDLRSLMSYGAPDIFSTVAQTEALERYNKLAERMTAEAWGKSPSQKDILAQMSAKDRALVKAAQLQQSVEENFNVLYGGRSSRNQAGRVFGELPEFGAQMTTTAGIANLAKFGTKKVAQEAVKRSVWQGLKKGTAAFGNAAVNNLARVPFTSMLYERKAELDKQDYAWVGDNLQYNPRRSGEKWALSLIDTYAEFLSEEFGPWIGDGLSKVGAGIARLKFLNPDYKMHPVLRKLRKDLKFSGFGGEVLSEASGDVMNNFLASFVEDNPDKWKDMLTSDYWTTLILSMGAMSGSFYAMTGADAIAYGRQLSRLYKKQESALEHIPDGEFRAKLLETFAYDDLGNRAKSLSNADWRSVDKVTAGYALDYINATTSLEQLESEREEEERMAQVSPLLQAIGNSVNLDEWGGSRESAIVFGETADGERIPIVKGVEYTRGEGVSITNDGVIYVRNGKGDLVPTTPRKAGIVKIQGIPVSDYIAEQYALMFGKSIRSEKLNKTLKLLDDLAQLNAPVETLIGVATANDLAFFEEGDNVTLIDGTQGSIFKALGMGKYAIQKADGTIKEVGFGDILQPNPEIAQVQVEQATAPEMVAQSEVVTQLQTPQPAALQIGDTVTISTPNGNRKGTISNYFADEGMYAVDIVDDNGRTTVAFVSPEELSIPTQQQEDIAQTVENPEAVVEPTSDTTNAAKIPKDEQGNFLYERVDSDTAWDAIVEQTEGDEAMAQTVADGMVADKEAALKKLEKAKSKGGATVAEKIAAEKERKAAIDAAQQELNIWKKIAGTAERRKTQAEAERKRVADEAAALRKAEEERLRAEREEAERIEREALEGVPDVVNDTPNNARARGYRRVNGNKIDRQQPLQGLQGKETAVRFSDDTIANGRVVIIDAEQLQPSHIQGSRNPRHFIDEAQPKERTDKASSVSAQRIAESVRPEEITSSVTAYTGAPIVNSRGEVIQGNNRSIALRLMWSNYKEQAAKYKQYLKEHAAEFGLRAEDIDAMSNPILVTMLDVTDEQAITLGQYVAQDTESGGVERIKPKNVLQKMGNDMRTFANMLLKSTDEEISFAGLIDSNGPGAIRWMNQRGYITDTQYESAFDSKGNLTAEAKNDLRGVMYQSIFKGGSTRLEEMFNAMPAKAQKAILATAYRDFDSPNSERMIEEIQNSIRAYYALSQSADFANAKTFKDARLAVESWKIQYQLDDATGESYLPADNFSNFALLLAAMYKGENQSVIQGKFNKLYDLIQGTQEASLFEQPDNTPRTLAQAIYETLNITYDGQLRSDVLAGDNSASQRGQQGSTGDAATGERIESGDRTADSAGSIEGEDGRSENKGHLAERQGDLGTTVETSDIEFDEDGLPFVISSTGTTVFGEIKEETGLTPAPIKLSLGNSKYGLVHLEKRHGKQIRNAGFNSVEEFVEYVCKNYKRIRQGENSVGEENGTYLLQIEDNHNNTLYVELSTDGSYWGVNSGGVFRKEYGNNKKEVWSASEVQNEQSATDSTLRDEDKSDNPTTPNGIVPPTSEGKDTINSPNSKESGKENAEAPVKVTAQEQSSAGLVRDDFTSTLEEKEANFIDALARSLGMRVRFVDSVAGGKANAQILGDEILIAKSGKTKGNKFLIGHELTHRMLDLSPEIYEDFVAAVRMALGEQEFANRYRTIQAQYTSANIQIDRNGIIDEIVADYAGELISNHAALDKFAAYSSTNRTLLEALIQLLKDIKDAFSLPNKESVAIDNAIDRLNDLFRDATKKVETEEDVEDSVIVKVWQDRYDAEFDAELFDAIYYALPDSHSPEERKKTVRDLIKTAKAHKGHPLADAILSNVKHTPNPSIRRRFSFIGERGAANLDIAEETTIRLDNLAVARDMETAKKDAKVIKMATGWERGADGLWRYETVDDITPNMIASLNGNRGRDIVAKRQQIIDELSHRANLIESAVYEREYAPDMFRKLSWDKEIADLYQGVADEYQGDQQRAKRDVEDIIGKIRNLSLLNKDEYTLEEVMGTTHRLFSAYPQLKDIKVVLEQNKNQDYGGYYSEANKTIAIVDYRDRGKSEARTLAHEVQHAIQYIEGFAPGINKRDELPLTEEQKRLSDIIRRALSYVNFHGKDVEQALSSDVKYGGFIWNTLSEDVKNVLLEYRKEHRRVSYDKIKEYLDNAYKVATKRREVGSANYRRQAGEVEARNVSERMYMTVEERLASLAEETEDVARESQLFLKWGAASRSKEKRQSEAKYSLSERVETLFNKAVSGNITGKPISIGTLTSEGKKYLERISGLKFRDKVDFVLNPSDLRHIYKRHFGENEKDSRNIPLDIEDIRSIVDIISNPDRVIYSVEEGQQERKMFSFLKEAEQGTYNLLEIYSDRKGNLTTKSFYKSKEGVSQRVISLIRTLHSTSETDGATLNDTKIPQIFELPKIEPKFSLRSSDALYLEAVERGDMAMAQRMVQEAAEHAGYLPDTSYQGSLAFNGAAPTSNVFFETKEERKQAWDKDEFEDTMSLGDYADNGIDTNDLEWRLTDAGNYRRATQYEKESIDNINQALKNPERKITIYRAVPNSVVEGSVRNGDWITPSRSYAEYHIGLQDWDEGRIIEQEVSIDDLWWGGDDINEWGYDDGSNYGYRNTENNRKLLKTVVYDDVGNIIPLSERFNPEKADVRYSIKDEESEKIFSTAKSKFGTTFDMREAGWILPDGSMLDFSGKHEIRGADTSFLNGRRAVDHRAIQEIAYDFDENETGVKTDLGDFLDRGAIRIDYNAGSINLNTAPTKAQKDRLKRLVERNDGDVYIDFGKGWDTEHYVEYESARPSRVIGDIDRYFEEGIKPTGNVRFSLKDDNAIENEQKLKYSLKDTFYSNAENAVRNIKQEKATPEQWLKMIEKNGGLKAGEDKWLGLSDWLKSSEKKSLTKEEVLQYINANKIQIEEVSYADIADVSEQDIYESEAFSNLVSSLTEYDEDDNPYISREKYEELRDESYDFVDGFTLDYWGESLEVNSPAAAASYLGMSKAEREINSTRLDYTTDGLENKREIALTVPTVESWGASDEIHFGDAGEGRAVAWIRFGETTIQVPHDYSPTVDRWKEPYENVNRDKVYKPIGSAEKYAFVVHKVRGNAEGYVVFIKDKPISVHNSLEEAGNAINEYYKNNPIKIRRNQRVLVIDEIQSKRHQEGREKGYRDADFEKERTAARERLREANVALEAYRNPLKEKYGFNNMKGSFFERLKAFDAALTTEERAEMNRLGEIRNKAEDEWNEWQLKATGIPSAPFEKNWAELAMKRMLRYAAENGFDKVAWTTGEQQAERYDLSRSITRIVAEDNKIENASDGTPMAKELTLTTASGMDMRMSVDTNGVVRGREYDGKQLSDVVGKPLAEKLMQEGDIDISGDGLRLGGEGMKAFYDTMLVNFMNKYGKKWGVKVGEVNMPNLENDTMHSIDVTDTMRESVMQGQPLFSLKDSSEEDLSRNHLVMQRAVKSLARSLNLNNVDVITDLSQLNERVRRAKGVYYLEDDKINVVIPNHYDVKDAEETVLHEAVAHYGLRQLFGEHFDEFLDNVFRTANKNIKAAINRVAPKYRWDYRIATEEYLAELAERGFNDYESQDFWDKVKRLFADMLRKAKIAIGWELNDNDLRYMLWRSYQMLKEGGTMATIRDLAMQQRLGVGNFRAREVDEEQQIITRAKANGTYLKAPNGKPTNLTPKQWVQVRTKAFKQWFGDWEKAARIEKLRESENAAISGEEIVITEDYKQNKKNALKYSQTFTGKYTNADTGNVIGIYRGRQNGGVNEVLQHNYKDVPHIQSIAAIPQIIEKSIYIETQPNNDPETNPDVTEYQCYVCGLNIAGEEYTVLAKVAVDKNGNRYYDHNLTAVAKGKLIDIANNEQSAVTSGFGTTPDTESTTNSQRKYRELISILQTNSSKIVDANGEPKVVYHGSVAEDLAVFDKKKIRANETDADYNGFWFSTDEQTSPAWRDAKKVYPVFLNIHKPILRKDTYKISREIDADRFEELVDKHPDIRSIADATRYELQDKGYDGVIHFAPPSSINEAEFKRTGKTIFVMPDGYAHVLSQGENGITQYEYDPYSENKEGNVESEYDSLEDFYADPYYFGDSVYVAFEPNQIKSASENDGSFNPDNDDIRYSLKDTMAPASSGVARQKYEAALKTNAYKLLEAYQDGMLSLRKLQEAILEETGNEMSSFEDAYRAENQLSSKNKGEAEVYIRDYFKPLQKAVAELTKNGVAYDELLQYMIAKHGLERNEVFAKRDADKGVEVKDDYSGLTAIFPEAEDVAEVAKAFIEEFERKHDTSTLWSKVNAATKATLRKSFESGLMSRDTYEKTRDMFKFYIPLRGWDADVAADEYEYMSSNRLMLSPTLKRAKGRSSVADDPIATIGNMAESAIVQGNRNLMKQRFLNFVLNNPTSLATVSEQRYVKNADNTWSPSNPNIPESATAEQVADIIEQHEEKMEELSKSNVATKEVKGLQLDLHTTASQRVEHAVRVNRNGKEYVIYINGNPLAAQAINGLTNPNNNPDSLHEGMMAVKNFMARNFTSQNPAFIFTNLVRDLIWATSVVSIKEDRAYVSKYTKNILSHLSSGSFVMYVHKFKKGTLDMNNDVERYFDEFIRNGGETGFTQINTVENYKRDMERMLEETQEGVNVVKKSWRTVRDGIEFMNRCAEDATRFAVYMTSRQMGRDVARSISDAKEITVNFNRKGRGNMGAKYLGFAYVFFNASVQSLANFGRLLKEHPVKTTMALTAFTSTGLILPLLNAFVMELFGVDDDKYWELPEWVRLNNLVFYAPWTEAGFITIPLPHEVRPFYAMGVLAMSVLAGKSSVEDALLKVGASFAELIPLDFLGNDGNLLVNITPTVFQPVAQIIANTDFFGKPIYRKYDYNKYHPEWTKAYKGNNAYLVSGAEWLNEVSGGDKYKAGAIDINPAWVEHIFEGYLGGMGKTLNKTIKTISMIWNEDMREVQNAPVVSSFYREVDERTSDGNFSKQYYAALEEKKKLQPIVSGYKREAQMGNEEYKQKYNELIATPEYKRYRLIQRYEDYIKKLNMNLERAKNKEEETKVQAMIKTYKENLLRELEKIDKQNK